MAPNRSQDVTEGVIQYYLWLSDNGGTDPETLLAQPLSKEAKRELLERMDDVNCLWGITAPLRNSRELNETADVPRPEERRTRI